MLIFCAAARECNVRIYNMADITHSYRIRAYPNGAQRRLLDRWFGGVRWLWNTTLEIRSAAYRECGLTLTGNDLSRWLTQWKRTSGHEWLAEIPATVLTQCLRDQDSAFRNFFTQRARYPRFKRKQHAGSLRFQDVGAAWTSGIVSLPKLGALKLAEVLPKVEPPDMVTLSRDAAGRYYVSFCAEVQKTSLPIRQRSVGVDLGLTHLATLSNGEKIPQSEALSRALEIPTAAATLSCPTSAGVLAREARSGRRNRACLEQARSDSSAVKCLQSSLVSR